MSGSSKAPSLPPAALQQAYCDVSILEGGSLTAHRGYILAGASPDDTYPAPCLAFLLTHSASGARLLFDLGVPDITKDAAPVSPAMRELMAHLQFKRPPDVPSSLRRGGLEPSDVETVILSHVHADHAGEPMLYTKARFFAGAGARTLLENGFPKDAKSHFVQNLFPEGRIEWLDPHGSDADKWKSIGPFEHALDFWGDGALYVVDAPGHMPGHLNLLVRTSSDGGWVHLAGDSAHDWRLLRGEADIAGNETVCVHADVDAARDMIRRIRELIRCERVQVVLNHDDVWYEKNREGGPEVGWWPGKLTSL